jgi:hypothetical protein
MLLTLLNIKHTIPFRGSHVYLQDRAAGSIQWLARKEVGGILLLYCDAASI